MRDLYSISLLLGATGAGGDNPSGPGGVVIILAIAFGLLAVAVGAIVLRGRRRGPHT